MPFPSLASFLQLSFSFTTEAQNHSEQPIHHMTIPVKEPSNIDVLCGRGGKQYRGSDRDLKNAEFAGKTNHHPGNILFRERIGDHHQEYMHHERPGKTAMTRELLVQFRSEGIRFLREDPNSGCYVDVGDQHARTKISQALRDNTTNGSKENKSRGKRVTEAEGNAHAEKRVKLSGEPRGSSSPMALPRSNTPREVSPVPSVGDIRVPVPSADIEVKKQAFRFNTRQRNSVLLPPDASLFEIVEGSKAGVDSESPKSQAVVETKSPLVLPELPSIEVPPLLLSSNQDDAIGSEPLSLNLDFPLGDASDDILVDAPREVSPLPSRVGNHNHGSVYQPFESEDDEIDFEQLSDFYYSGSGPVYDSQLSLFDDTPMPALLRQADQRTDTRSSFMLCRLTDGFSSISQLNNDDDFTGSKD